MGLVAWLVLGALAGWLGSIVMKTNAEQGLLTNIIVGVIGAVVGGYIFEALGNSGVNGFNLYSLLVATIGSVIALAIYKALTGKGV